MKFYGREQEQKRLRRALTRDGLQVVLVYGRRRVGKSELIKHCVRDLPGINYECKQTTEQNNVHSLSA